MDLKNSWGGGKNSILGGFLLLMVACGVKQGPSLLQSSNRGISSNQTTTLQSISPSGNNFANFSSAPTAITLNFSGAVMPVSLAAFSVSGSCSTLPSITSVSMSSGNLNATANLSGGTCNSGQNFAITVNPANISDANGAAIVGTVSTSSYIILSPAALAFDAPYDNEDHDESHTFTLSNSGHANATIGNVDMTILGFTAYSDSSLVSYIGGTCANSTVSPGQTCTINVQADDHLGQGNAHHETIALPYNDGYSTQQATSSIYLDNC